MYSIAVFLNLLISSNEHYHTVVGSELCAKIVFDTFFNNFSKQLMRKMLRYSMSFLVNIFKCVFVAQPTINAVSAFI